MEEFLPDRVREISTFGRTLDENSIVVCPLNSSLDALDGTPSPILLT